MGRGLEAILQRIEETPDERLISRYLALVSDLSEEERARRALDLAAALVGKDAKESMRIAHMVYKADPLNVRAIDIIIEALTKLGRHAKAEVLRNERDKLVERAEQEKLEPSSSSLDLESLAESYGGQALELDLGMSEGEGEVEPHDLLFTSARQSPPEDVAASLAVDEEEREREPGPTFLLADEAPASEGDGVGREELARTFKLADLDDVSRKEGSGERDRGAREFVLFSPRQETSHTTLDRLFEEGHEQVPETDLGVAVELFDYYWKQGYVAEARELLEQARPVAAHESWWQARRALVEKSALGFGPPPNWPPTKLDTNDENRRQDDPKSFWEAVDAELGRLERRRDGFAAPVNPSAEGRESRRLEPKALDALVEIVRAHATDRALEDVVWELVSGLWGSAPSPDASELLQRLSLTETSPAFFGVYLDGLIAEGRGRRALVQARRALDAHPTLEWAEVIAVRAESALRALGMRHVRWCKEDGLKALQTLLAERPRPRLETLIAR